MHVLDTGVFQRRAWEGHVSITFGIIMNPLNKPAVQEGGFRHLDVPVTLLES